MSDAVKKHDEFMQKLKNVIMEYEQYRKEVEGDDVLLYKVERVTKDIFTTVWMSKVKGAKCTYVADEGTFRKYKIT
jgi:hypothetical protein